jgi:2-polyprenyl-3-methyl-5-hydroxy-6-metoxy-1,4-benzoquinol methylase
MGKAAWMAEASDRLFHLVPGHFQLYRCAACRCVFQHPLPPENVLASFYPAEYWWAGRQESPISRAISGLERAYRESVILDHVRFLERCVPGRGRMLLDIGCGPGTFLHLARRRGFQAHGMDVSARAVAEARDQYHLEVRHGGIGSDLWSGMHFDVITMFHVLEHLPDPRRALAYTKDLLAPDGSLILQVPNADSCQARRLGVRWYGFDVPRHIINFTPRSLALLLEQAGYEGRLVPHFSLRDNPTALASSLAMDLDPIGRRGRGRRWPMFAEGLSELCYFGLVLLSLIPTWVETRCGYGATLWAHARVKK